MAKAKKEKPAMVRSKTPKEPAMVNARIEDRAVTTPMPRTVKIEKIDQRGKGKSFRFFVKNSSGQILTAKIYKNHVGYEADMEVPVSDLFFLAVASEKQLARYNSGACRVIDQSLLD
jgi:hypothetical protein